MSLPLTSFAMNFSLAEFGMLDLARERIGFYFDNFIYEDGTINMLNWDPLCLFEKLNGKGNGQFNDGLADYGRILDLYLQTLILDP